MAAGKKHQGWQRFLDKAEEGLLARTLEGRKLERDLLGDDGGLLVPAGTEIDRGVLDRAREQGRLEELAHAAEPGTSDSELEELFFWRKHHRDRDHSDSHPSDPHPSEE